MEKRTITFLSVLFAVIVLSMHLAYKAPPEVPDMMDMARQMKAQGNWKGKVAPDFEVRTLDGSTFKLSEHVGKEVVVLNFFATWCGPCNEEMPELGRFYANYNGKQFAMVGIDASEKEELVKAFVDKHFVNYPVGIDGNGDIQRKFGVNSFPTTVIIGVDGRVRVYESGSVSNWEVSFKKTVDDNLALLAQNKGVTVEVWQKLAAGEKYEDVMAQEGDDEDEIRLEGRAKDIAQKMTCPCGCSDKVADCGCDTSEKIKKALKERDFGDKSDVDIIKELNAEFCVKESGC